MQHVSIRDLRNHGGEVIDRLAGGERVTITRNGRPVAELTALGNPPARLESLIARRRSLPQVDPVSLRRDLDDLLDGSIL